MYLSNEQPLLNLSNFILHHGKPRLYLKISENFRNKCFFEKYNLSDIKTDLEINILIAKKLTN